MEASTILQTNDEPTVDDDADEWLDEEEYAPPGCCKASCSCRCCLSTVLIGLLIIGSLFLAYEGAKSARQYVMWTFDEDAKADWSSASCVVRAKNLSCETTETCLIRNLGVKGARIRNLRCKEKVRCQASLHSYVNVEEDDEAQESIQAALPHPSWTQNRRVVNIDSSYKRFTSEKAASEFLGQFAINQTHPCWFDPGDVSDVAMSVGGGWVKRTVIEGAVMTATGLVLALVLLCCVCCRGRRRRRAVKPLLPMCCLSRQDKIHRFHDACFSGNTQKVKSILFWRPTLVNAAIPSTIFQKGFALHIATQSCDDRPDMIVLLLRHGADVDSVEKESGNSSLHIAATYGYGQVAELLLKSGATVDMKNHLGQSPLHCVAQYGQEHLVAILLAHGANIEALDNNGSTALDLALQGDCSHAADKTGSSVYMVAAELVARGAEAHRPSYLVSADINAKKKDRKTMLHFAASGGHVEAMEVLLKHGGKADAMDRFGYAPIHLAAMLGHERTAEVLLKHDDLAELKAADERASTPLHLAAEAGHQNMVRLLLDPPVGHGARTGAKDSVGNTPLHYAVAKGHREVSELLISHGADVYAPGKDGKTPHFLAQQRSAEASALVPSHRRSRSSDTYGLLPVWM